MKKKTTRLLLSFICILFAHQPITAQFVIDGNVQNFNAIQTYSNHELVSARNRVNILLNRSLRFGEFVSEFHLYNNYSDSFEFDLLFRELFINIFTTNYDVKIGLQRLRTGRSNTGFITDIYSGIDFREFLTKEPNEIELGTLAINIRRYFNQNSIQLIINPLQNRSRLPEIDSRWFPVQIGGPIALNLINYDQKRLFSQLNGALRYSNRSIPELDLDLNVSYWTYPTPSLGFRFKNRTDPQNLELDLFETYEQSLMLGLSAQYQLSSSWFLTTETLFVQNRLFTFITVPQDQLENTLTNPELAFQVINQLEDRDDNYLTEKPWVHTMAGLQSEIYGITISGQLYLEWILNYDQNLFSQQFFPYATILLSRSMNRDRLQLSTLNRYNFAGNDWLFQFQSTYEISDGFEVSMGINLMNGNDVEPFYGHFSFSQYRNNSFIFSRITYYF